MIDLRLGDCLDTLPTLEAESVDTVIVDPPYGLVEPRSGGNGSGIMWAPRDEKTKAARRGGFMGKKWDACVPGPEYWAECLRVAKPGAMLCAFGGTRTHHRLMCAIEDAGWEIRDVLMWVYGSGFPKSHDVSKAIDKAAGAERPDAIKGGHRGISTSGGDAPSEASLSLPTPHSVNRGALSRGTPATDAAQLWDGWGTALKPAYEPIILAMKPLPGTFAQNALDYGVAGIWVDGCRVGTEVRTQKIIDGGNVYGPKDGEDSPTQRAKNGKVATISKTYVGRWPANLLLSHAPGCECVGVRKVQSNGRVRHKKAPAGMFCGGAPGIDGHASPDGTETIGDWRCVPGCPVRLLDEQSGESTSNPYRANKGGVLNTGSSYGQGTRKSDWRGPSDTGGASRFFTRFHYSAKASRSERELGLLGHIPCLKCGLLDSVTHMNVKTGKEEKCRRNGHPTVKPLDVCRWLCRLTRTPTGGVVLDPFMGSGRIPMAAILEGRDTIGIELERPSFEIAQAGVNYIQAEMVQARMAV